MNLKPSIYDRKKRWKIWLFVVAIAIGIFTLLYTDFMVKQLSREERNKMQQWADAYRLISSSEDLNSETLNYLVNNVIRANKTIPVILVDEKGNINSVLNFDTLKDADPKFLQSDFMMKQLQSMQTLHGIMFCIIKKVSFLNNCVIIRLFNWASSHYFFWCHI